MITYIFRLFLKVSIFLSWRILFGKALYSIGAQFLNFLLVNPGLGTLFSVSFHMSGLLCKLIICGSQSLSISFKYKYYLHCTNSLKGEQMIFVFNSGF